MTTKKLINLNFNTNIDSNSLLKYTLKHFPCGECEFAIQEEIGDCEIEIYQSFEVGKFNDDLMKLQIVCNVLKRNNVKHISYFAPFLPYARQDKDSDLTHSFGARLIAEIIHNCGINEITTYDFHTLELAVFFQGQVHHLSAVPLFLDNIDKHFDKKDIVIVFPDAGSVLRFKRFFDNTEYEVALIQKTRKENNIDMKLLGEVSEKTAIIIDDMIDGGGTIIEASKLLKNHNANSILVYATHGIFSGNAVDKLTNTNEIEKITITNSLIQNQQLSEKFEVIKI